MRINVFKMKPKERKKKSFIYDDAIDDNSWIKKKYKRQKSSNKNRFFNELDE